MELSPAGGCLPQVLASDALTTLCASSSGKDGCAFAEQEEVDVLLCALLSPCASVRDTALRVRAHSLLGLPWRPLSLSVPVRAALMGDAAHMHQGVLEAKRRGHRVWFGVILGIGTAKQLSCITAYFFLHCGRLHLISKTECGSWYFYRQI